MPAAVYTVQFGDSVTVGATCAHAAAGKLTATVVDELPTDNGVIPKPVSGSVLPRVWY